ncbi:vascular endothelial growth factor receptor 1 isoform 1-T1 [Anomaloglossus baeobatrachus]|uniref:vascular endothelial growth factor receptor 1 n=1 Tax=Anomaloglossus baeobatrachus TaxID=238106 RepID=UPI003F4FB763
MISCAAVAMLCLMFGCLMLTGHSSGSKLKTPVLNIKAKELVVRVGQPIHLSCRGDQTVSWKFPAASRKESKRFHISDNSGQRSPDMPCNSSLTLHSAQLSDTGLYSCHYPYITTAKNPTAIYIFVSDERTAFVDTHNREPQIITITEGERLVIPCRVTSPNITVTLRQSFGNVLLSGNKNVVWDSRKGFIIRNPTYPFFDLLNCEATVNGVLQTSTYFTNKQSSAIYKVRLNVPSSIRLLRNANLTINCTVSTALNSRAEIQWTYPGLKFGKQASIIKRVVLSDSEALVYSMLIIHNVMSIDQGFYTCTAKNGPSTKTVNTTVRVHAHPYINAKPRRTGVLEAMVGQKSYRIAVKVRAFPPPEITWWKNNLLAADKCARYIIHNNVLTIKDVAEEDAGDYTVSLKLKQWNLVKNITMSLIVNVKPKIYEKSMSIQEPQPYTLSSRQTLTCTVFGVPPPRVTWTWRPCTRNHFGSSCDIHSGSSIPLIIGKNSSSMGNKIYSVTERTRLIEGRNKTAGILVVEDVSASGIYTCTAANKLGNERRDIHFYVTDVPNGFHITTDRLAKEGENMTLTCSVNKYLYTNISWILRRRVGNRTINHSISKHRNAITTEYSTILTVVVQNATQADSGIYECRATNTFTGDIMSESKDIIMKGEHSNRKVHLSRTSKQRRKNYSTESSTTQ